jgi:GMP synthase (glutamine-hydrolysing)
MNMRNKRLLIIEHDIARATGFHDFLDQADFDLDVVTWRTYLHEAPPNGSYDGLIMGGGHWMVGDLNRDCPAWYITELELLDEMLGKNQPILGICLGAQILCDHLGGVVQPRQLVIGWQSLKVNPGNDHDELTSRLPQELTMFELHRDHLIELPPDSYPVMTSENSLYEGFRIEGKRAWGFIFHPEIEPGYAVSLFNTAPLRLKEAGWDQSSLASSGGNPAPRAQLLQSFCELVIK